jgi:hypothetical protein
VAGAAGRRLPADRLDIEIELSDDASARRVRLTPHGAWEGRGLSSEREALKAAFLRAAGFGDARRELAGRRRLHARRTSG